MPSAVPITTSSVPRASITETSESFSSMESAFRPLGRGREKADRAVRFTRPLRVTNEMYGPLLISIASSAVARASSSALRGRSPSSLR